MRTILAVVGTRPEMIKMAPVIIAFRQRSECRTVVCTTGQHRQLVDEAMALFDLDADLNLDVMEPNQELSSLTARLFERFGAIVRDLKPDWILAQGDTTSVMVAAMTAFYQRTRFGHVEAGLRSRNLAAPFPEEINRVIADRVSDLRFAPTEWAKRNLLDEGVAEATIRVTGNTVVDALHIIAARDYDWRRGPLADVPRDRRLMLVTAHRRESFGRNLERQAAAVRAVAERYPHEIHVVWPVHPNPNVIGPVAAALEGLGNVSLVGPLDYLSLVQVMRRAAVIVTDSGGIQEEAPTFGVPVLVTRDTTERPEGVQCGVARLIGAGGDRIVAEVSAVLENPSATAPCGTNPYGDGRAATRIADAVLAC